MSKSPSIFHLRWSDSLNFLRNFSPQTKRWVCGSFLDHLQLSTPFLKCKYYHWCYLNTVFSKAAVKSHFSFLLLVTTFPFVCPFGIIWHCQLLLCFLCSPTRVVWCYSLARWLSIKMHLVSIFHSHVNTRFSLLCMMDHFSFCVHSANTNGTAFPANTTSQLPSSHLLLCSYDFWLSKIWAREPHIC